MNNFSPVQSVGRASQRVRGGVVAGREVAKNVKKASGEERAAMVGEKVQSFGNAPLMGFYALLPAFVLRKVRAEKLAAHPRALGKALTSTPMQITLADAARVPGEALRVAADQYHINGHTAARVEAVNGLATKADGLMGKMQAGVIDPLTRKGGRFIDKVTDGKSGGWLSGKLQGFAQAREKASLGKAVPTQLLGTIEKKEGFTALQNGVFANFDKMARRSVDGMDAAARATHFDALAAEARSVMAGGKNNAVRAIGEEMAQIASKASLNAKAALKHGEAAASGKLNVLVKNALRYGGRMPLMVALMGIGAVGGSMAIFFRTRHTNKEEAKMLDSMGKDLGEGNGAFMQNARSAQARTQSGRWMAGGVTAAGEAVIAGTMGATGGFGGGLGMAAVIAPQFAGIFQKDTPQLQAYTLLKRAEQGEVELAPAEKVAQVRQLVGAAIDTVPQPGKKNLPGNGFYNKLAQPIAAKLVNEKTSLHDTMQLLGDLGKFTAYADEVKASLPKVAAAATPAPANAPAEDPDINTHKDEIAYRHAEAYDAGKRRTAIHRAHAAHANDNATEARYLAAEKPGKMQLDQCEHAGMLEQLQQAQGKK